MLNIFRKHKKSIPVVYDVRDELQTMTDNIFCSFNFKDSDIRYIMSTETNDFYYTPKNSTIIIGIQKYIDSNSIDATEKIYFQNSVLHECIHADTHIHMPIDLKQKFKQNRLSYAYWAFKLLDEYKAYSESNEVYKQDAKFLKNKEEKCIEIMCHYCQKLKPQNTLDYQFVDSYYDFASAFIAHKCVNPNFPTIHDPLYLDFLESYFNHLKQGIESDFQKYNEYEIFAKKLLNDFKLLFHYVKKENPDIRMSYENFLKNSHMN